MATSSPPLPKGAQHPSIFCPCLLWLNGRPSQLLLSTCYNFCWRRKVSYDLWNLFCCRLPSDSGCDHCDYPSSCDDVVSNHTFLWKQRIRNRTQIARWTTVANVVLEVTINIARYSYSTSSSSQFDLRHINKHISTFTCRLSKLSQPIWTAM